MYRFGSFEVDLELRLLFRAGESVPLTPKSFDTLVVLVERRGKVVDKAELLQLVWPDIFVEENNLTQNISALRKAFGGESYIETIPRRGYRFLPEVEEAAAAGADQVVTPKAKFRAVWLWVPIAVAAAVTIAFYTVERIRGAVSPTFQVDSLVVLPFVNLTANPEDGYFCDGLTEELTNSVAHLDGLRVIARTTAFQFKGKARDIRSIARQLHVKAVLEGSVRRQDDQFRITVQLNNAESGYHIWSQTYDRDASDILSIQESISNQVAHSIRPNGTTARSTGGNGDQEAYRLYLLGRFYRSRPDEPSIRKAMAFFHQAIDKKCRIRGSARGLGRMLREVGPSALHAGSGSWGRRSKSLG